MSEDPPPGSPAALRPANRLLALAEGERPQERALKVGVGNLSDFELLALILRSGTRGHDVLTLAEGLLAEAGSLHALARWHETDFRRLKGIGRVKALQLCTVMEVVRRVLQAERLAPATFTEPEHIVSYLGPRTLGLTMEKCWVLTLNTRNRLQRCVELTTGTATQTRVRASEVIREVVRDSATGFIVAHNHPRGDPSPSAADNQITRRIRTAAEALELTLHDHVILGDAAHDPLGQGYYSFRAAGLL
jgi:DNA repair protein RadC